MVYRSHRPTLTAFARQVFGYGRGRMGQAIIRPSPTCLIRMTPAVFVLYLLSLAAWRPWWYLLPLAPYAALIGAAAVWHAIHNRTPAGGLMSAWLLPFMHIAYGCGLLYGLCHRLGRHEEPPGAGVQVRVVKALGS
jgi:4-amino-4-deoxy-L-arabinose transferase-like glycosyltransferase